MESKAVIDRNIIKSILCKKYLTFKTNVDFDIMANKAHALGNGIEFKIIRDDIGTLEINDKIILMTNKEKLIAYGKALFINCSSKNFFLNL